MHRDHSLSQSKGSRETLLFVGMICYSFLLCDSMRHSSTFYLFLRRAAAVICGTSLRGKSVRLRAGEGEASCDHGPTVGDRAVAGRWMRGPARLRAGRFGQKEISFVNEPYSDYPFVQSAFANNGHIGLREEESAESETCRW